MAKDNAKKSTTKKSEKGKKKSASRASGPRSKKGPAAGKPDAGAIPELQAPASDPAVQASSSAAAFSEQAVETFASASVNEETRQAPAPDQIAPAPPAIQERVEADQAPSPAEAPSAQAAGPLTPASQAETAPVPDQIAPAPPAAQERAEADQAPSPAEAPSAQAAGPLPPASQAETAPVPDQIAPAPPAAQERAENSETPLPAAATAAQAGGTLSAAPAKDEARRPDPVPPPPGGGGTGSGRGNGPNGSPDPVLRAAKVGGAILALLLILILWASITNNFRYFLVPQNGSAEVWRGDFSPNGRHFMTVLHGVRPSEPVRASYSRRELFPMIFTYYLDKADALLEVEGLPDYSSINDYLHRADRFALNQEMHKAVEVRRSRIQRVSLLYRADLDASKGDARSLQSALENLNQARRLTVNPAELQGIDQRIAQIRQRLASAPSGSQ